jgi:hypothetical protein
MTTNIQSFAGDVEVHSGNLSVKSLEVKDPISKFGSNNSTYSNVGLVLTAKEGSNVAFYYDQTNANVVLGYTNSEANDGDRVDVLTDERANLMVYGNVYVTGSVHGDGSTLTGLVTTLQSVTEFGANTTQMVEFEHPTTGINVFSNVLVAGNVTALTFIGDGSQLEGIAANLQEIVNNGNVTSNTVQFTNATTAFITTSNVGIANSSPTADLCVGSNVVIDDDARDVLQVTGNVNCHGLFLQSVSILPGYGLDTVTGISNSTPNTISITNSTLSLITSSMAGIGIVPDSTDVSSKGLHVDGHLRLGGPAATTDNEQMYLKSAGELTIRANDSDTTNLNTKLILQTGDTSNSNITMEGNTNQQFMTFGVGATERMRIEQDGNVGINVTSASYTLDVGGDIRFDGNLYQGDGPFVATPWTITGDDIYYTVADGSVGIGTATTGATFHTEGNVVINTTMSDSTSNGGVVIDGGIAVSGNVHTGNLYVVNNVHIQSVQVDATPDLGSVCAVAATTDQAVSITNTTASTSVGSGALTVDGGVGVDGNLYVGGNLAFPTPAVATTAGNVITWNSTTGLLEDSGGLLANKFAVVSEQPPSALTANSTTVTDHGVYKLTTSGLATDSNTWNAFNGDASDAWTSLSTYTGTDNVYGGSVQLSAVSSTGSGEWLAVEFPYKTTLRHMKLTPAAVASYPGTANLYATNDSTSWTLLKEWSDVVPGSESEVQTVVVDASAAYKKFAIVPTKAAGASTSVAIERWQLFAESFAVDGGKVAMASGAITGGNTVVDQTGPHARGPVPLRKYPEMALSSNVQSGYVTNVSSQFTTYYPYRAFDGKLTAGDNWSSADSVYNYTSPWAYTGSANLGTDSGGNATNGGEYIQIELPNKILLNRIALCVNRYTGIQAFTLYGSNDGVSWTELLDDALPSSVKYDNFELRRFDVNTATYYKHFGLVAKTGRGEVSSHTYVTLQEWELYGYEETSDPDTSVDTKITSQFNLPDTTGVKLYIDGDKGSTATDFSGEGHTLTENNATYDSAEKAWEFSSLSTSNVTMTSGDLAMEGTHPHSVSLWFNAANVSSNATLFHVGTAAGEGDAKTSISLTESGHLGWIDGGDNQFLSANTWHNLVYATQGGGGVRTCYLDGRKLGDVSVQDTFGDYPPFAMTGYSQGGYTVSASSFITNFDPWEAFSDVIDDSSFCWSVSSAWTATDNFFGGTTSIANEMIINLDGVPNTTVGGVGGHWINLKLPHKLIVDYVVIYPRYAPSNDWDERVPEQFYIVGSNDGYHWYTIHHKNTNGVPAIGDPDRQVTTGAYRNIGFKNIRMYVTKVGNSKNRLDIGNISYYGHKENDTTRFPISSSVQKYPHITMTGYAQRGYVATASSLDNPSSNNGLGLYPAYHAFDEISSTEWLNEVGYYSNGNYIGGETTSENSNTWAGDWLQIQTPTKIRLTGTKIARQISDTYGTYRSPRQGAIVGSNDGSSWQYIYNWSGLSTTDFPGGGVHKEFTFTTTASYKYYRLIVEKNQIGNYNNHVSIGSWQLLGTEEDLDVVARVGEGLDGKVANFRVYDKYLHEEQALELWDAQKDQFGRAESSVSVYRGHVGIGTTTPSAALTVMDEAEEMEELPPRAMTGYETYMDGHGVFRASASIADTSSRVAWCAFTKSGALFWRSDNDGDDYNTTTGVYEGARQLGSNTPSGEYLTLELPYDVKLVKFSLLPFPDSTYYEAEFPRDFTVYGRKNRSENWEIVQSFTDSSATAYYIENHYTLQSSDFYRSFAISVTKNNSENAGTASAFTSIGEWRLFGTRERGQSTLHDGSLTLTKNLTVPSIGPSVTDTRLSVPRRERLVLEYDTSTNPTDTTTVIDTSGAGNDGTLNNGAVYSLKDRAFTFDGTNDYVRNTSPSGLPTGDAIYSISAWVNIYTYTSSSTVVAFGSVWGCLTLASMYIASNGELAHSIGCNQVYTTNQTIKSNTWHHAVVVKKGTGANSVGNIDLYVDGLLITDKTVSGTGTQNIGSAGFVTVGAGPTPSELFNGKISNPKLWNVALTADEVKRLYDMGRGDSYHATNFQNTLVGINLGNGRAPRSALDVRDKIYARSSTVDTFTGQHRCSSAEGPLEKGLVVSAKKNKFVKLNGSLSTGKKAITIDESLPVVSLSNVAQDKACFGVVSRMEEANTLTRSETAGGLISEAPKVLGDNRVIVNSVGEGAIWVCDANGPLESGDYITTSNVAGYGQKQTGEFLANYTVAKITMDCDFTGSNVAVQAIKKVETLKTVMEDVWEGLSDYDRDETSETQYSNTLSPVAYSDLTAEARVGYTAQTLTTIVDYTDGSNVISVAAWSNLESNVQETYTSNTHTEIVDYTKFIDVGEWSNLETAVQNTYSDAEVFTYYRIQRGENVLDEHGMLQWEDTGATEPGYEVRYLDATGQQTDEANCVHRAAFVGCTYHCG